MAAEDRSVLALSPRQQIVRWLQRHALLLLSALLVIALLAAFWQMQQVQRDVIRGMAMQGAKLQAISLTELRTLYTAEVVERVRHQGIVVSHDYRERPAAIPLPATLTIELSEHINNSGQELQVRLYSDYPFPWRSGGGPRDAFEREALLALRANPEQAFVRAELFNGAEAIRYAVADRMRAQCVDCHNRHPDSPKRDWQTGDVRGVLEIIRPIAASTALAQTSTRRVFLLLGLAVVLSLIGITIIWWQQKRSQQQLQEEVALRTRELAQRNDELEQFAYIASHDLQEPLRMITSYLQLLERRYKTQLDDNAREFIGFAVDGSKRLQALINDLLNYSRLGRKASPFCAVDMNQLLSDVCANLQLQIRDSGTVVSHDALPTVNGDASQLSQVLQNLLGNAMKFRRDDTPTIHVSCAQDDDAWHFRVQDNGIGIAAEHFERIFQVFQRLHTREKYPGTGIGLAIVRKIIERHGGRIWLESVEGQGCCFHFTLPVEPPR